MLPADLDTYGGAKSDAFPVEDSETQMSSDEDNLRTEHLAQLTRTPTRICMRFLTRTSNGTVTVSARMTLWGDTASFDPTSATRTSAGVYVFTWPAQFTDGLDTTENLTFWGGKGNVADSNDFGFVNVVASGTTVTVYIASTAGAASDLTASTPVEVFIH